MSDTPSEIRDHMEPILVAKGNVLIAGLGIGMVLQACLEKPEVKHVTVIELSPEVIELVGGHYKAKYGDRLTIIQADIMEWKPPKGERWDVFWADIWDNKCGDNTDEMTKLNRRYGRRTDWKACWGEWTCRDANRRWAREKKNAGNTMSKFRFTHDIKAADKADAFLIARDNIGCFDCEEVLTEHDRRVRMAGAKVIFVRRIDGVVE